MKIIKTYKGQTDRDKTDKTRQENASYDMPFFFLKKHERKRFVDIKKFYTNKQAIA